MDSERQFVDLSFAARKHPVVQFMDFVALVAGVAGFYLLHIGHDLVGGVLLAVGGGWVFFTHPLALFPLMLIAAVFLHFGRGLYDRLAER